MKDYRFRIGLLLTTVWLCYTGYMLHVHAEPADLSAWGNFLSGFASPIAFLWLVLGYMQQGEELKQSTKALQLQAEELKHSTAALNLQAEELKNSVSQQTEMVRITREQLAHEQAAFEEQRELRREAAKPKFVVQSDGSSTSGGVFEAKLVVQNLGAATTAINLRFEPELGRNSSFDLGAMSNQQQKLVQLVIDGPKAAAVKGVFSYIDADGVPGQAQFDFNLSSDLRFFIGPVRRAG